MNFNIIFNFPTWSMSEIVYNYECDIQKIYAKMRSPNFYHFPQHISNNSQCHQFERRVHQINRNVLKMKIEMFGY